MLLYKYAILLCIFKKFYDFFTEALPLLKKALAK